MKPATIRPRPWFEVWLSMLAATLLAGCTSPLLLTSSDTKEVKELAAAEAELEPEEDGVLLVKDVLDTLGFELHRRGGRGPGDGPGQDR